MIQSLINDGHFVYAISPVEKRKSNKTPLIRTSQYCIIKPRVGNITNTGFFEKAISIYFYKFKIISAIKKNVDCVDLFISAVPPITNNSIIKFIKRKFNAKTYLLLKDIWPDSMFDLKMGILSPFKWIAVFSMKILEKSLYINSDLIGCLSQANVDYLLSHHKYLKKEKVHINPNSIRPTEFQRKTIKDITRIRQKYNIPLEQKIFIHGGTVGVGQGFANIINCMDMCSNLPCHFVFAGNGVGFYKLKDHCLQNKIENISFIDKLSQPEYIELLSACDIGLIFLRFSAKTPNIPSKLLTYLDCSIPVLSCNDLSTDLPEIIKDGDFGWSCLSDSPFSFKKEIESIINVSNKEIAIKGQNGKQYLVSFFNVENSKRIIISSVSNDVGD